MVEGPAKAFFRVRRLQHRYPGSKLPDQRITFRDVDAFYGKDGLQTRIGGKDGQNNRFCLFTQMAPAGAIAINDSHGSQQEVEAVRN